jgi:hypothetical protein
VPDEPIRTCPACTQPVEEPWQVWCLGCLKSMAKDMRAEQSGVLPHQGYKEK